MKSNFGDILDKLLFFTTSIFKYDFENYQDFYNIIFQLHHVP